MTPQGEGWIPAITLWQPWASLVFIKEPRVKLYETRSWLPPKGTVGERVAIHAAARKIGLRDKAISEELHELCMDVFGCSYNYSLPYGEMIGTALLSSVASTEALIDQIGDDEKITGNWNEGRYGWRLDDTTEFSRPLPMRGFQRVWHWFPTPPTEGA